MYALKLALLLAAATASYAYPVSSNNPDLPTLLAHKPESRFSGVIENPRAHKRQVRNADYQANTNPPSPNPTTTRDSSPPPPAPSEPTPKDKRADTALWRGSGVSSNSEEAGQRRSTTADSSPLVHVADQKRQIHNADYQANNHPAQQSSPANAPAAAPSSSPSKDKRTVPSDSEDSVVVSSSNSPVDHSETALEKESHGRGPSIGKRAHIVDFGFGEGSWYVNRALKLEESHDRDCD